MNIIHCGLEIELPDEWLMEADMLRFVPGGSSYLVDTHAFPDRDVFEVCVRDVAPVRRSVEVGIFNFDQYTGRTARERVVSILRGFRSGAKFPPVEVVRLPDGQAHRYKLVAGAHRFYCSLAIGFSSVPAVSGFDRAWLDE